MFKYAQTAPITRILELWDETGDGRATRPLQALDAARSVATDPRAHPVLLSLAWHAVARAHAVQDWPVPPYVELSRCRSAATSLGYAASSSLHDLNRAVTDHGAPTTLLGVLPSTCALFGRWDLVGGGPFTVVRSDGEWGARGGDPSLQRWTDAVQFLHDKGSRCRDVQIAAQSCHLPCIEMIVCRKAPRAADGRWPESLLFIAAVRRCEAEGRWPAVVALADRLGCGGVLSTALMRWGMCGQVEAHLPRHHRIGRVVRRAVGYPAL